MHQTPRTTLFIDKSRIAHNLKCFSTFHELSKVTPVLKANAYGHGIKTIVSVIDGLFDYFAVTTLEECRAYLDLKTTFKILHGPIAAYELKYDKKVSFVISLPSHLKYISEYGQCTPRRYWLKVDLGLNRLGFSISEARELLKKYPNLWQGVVGHLGAVDFYPDVSYHQAMMLKSLARQYNLPLSLENTEGFARWREKPLGDYLRLGLAFYGYSKKKELPILPIARLTSKIIKTFPAGNKMMGYGWSNPIYNPVCLLPIGYGDGLSPHLAGLTIDNNRFRLRDPVMMDLCYMEKLCSESCSHITWFGDTAQCLLDIAQYLKVKPYAVLASLTQRINRVTIDGSVHCQTSKNLEVLM